MPKLKVTLIGKCPKCGSDMGATVAKISGVKLYFLYCKNSSCRYAEEKYEKLTVEEI